MRAASASSAATRSASSRSSSSRSASSRAVSASSSAFRAAASASAAMRSASACSARRRSSASACSRSAAARFSAAARCSRLRRGVLLGRAARSRLGFVGDSLDLVDQRGSLASAAAARSVTEGLRPRPAVQGRYLVSTYLDRRRRCRLCELVGGGLACSGRRLALGRDPRLLLGGCRPRAARPPRVLPLRLRTCASLLRRLLCELLPRQQRPRRRPHRPRRGFAEMRCRDVSRLLSSSEMHPRDDRAGRRP